MGRYRLTGNFLLGSSSSSVAVVALMASVPEYSFLSRRDGRLYTNDGSVNVRPYCTAAAIRSSHPHAQIAFLLHHFSFRPLCRSRNLTYLDDAMKRRELIGSL